MREMGATEPTDRAALLRSFSAPSPCQQERGAEHWPINLHGPCAEDKACLSSSGSRMVGFPMTVPGICNGPPWAATVTRQAIAPALPRRAARPLSPFEGIEHGPPLHPRTSLRSPGAAHRGATRLVRWTDP